MSLENIENQGFHDLAPNFPKKHIHTMPRAISNKIKPYDCISILTIAIILTSLNFLTIIVSPAMLMKLRI
jgi:hypothetical protein